LPLQARPESWPKAKRNNMRDKRIDTLLKEARQSQKEYQRYQEECEKDDNVLNDWERTENANFADGYRAGIRYALSLLDLITEKESMELL
jgi:uncharacterized protein YlxW (UPF0749 family)